jgi:hypothetical protein
MVCTATWFPRGRDPTKNLEESTRRNPLDARRNRMASRRARTLAAILGLVALSASHAAAVDGEILIDQARVNAGGITPDDAPGFPATLSRPGRYKLTGNLNVPADLNGIEVTQHNVTIALTASP